ncbi:hypothetical protein Taro_025216, partial [Colocasia esculenta]|nr:hypothetical protein [Colocasia esculenta]
MTASLNDSEAYILQRFHLSKFLPMNEHLLAQQEPAFDGGHPRHREGQGRRQSSAYQSGGRGRFLQLPGGGRPAVLSCSLEVLDEVVCVVYDVLQLLEPEADGLAVE